jgi:catechol 2,3-dioxygenase-like lactoylglutathione lyase family enzyme
MAHVEGVGGAFVFSNDPARLADWYRDHFGFAFEGDASTFYQAFWTLDPADPSRRVDTSFAIMRAKVPTRHAAPATEPEGMYGDQPFMVNLRVRDIDATVRHLESKGVRILGRQDEPYGRFAWVRDADGYRVEIYQSLPQ